MRQEIEYIRSIQAATGTKEKHNIIVAHKEDEVFTRLLFYACNPMLTYKLTAQTLEQDAGYNPAITLVFTDIFEVCESLSSRRALDDVTRYQVLAFLSMQPEYEKSFYKELLAKTLRLGVTAKSINKAIPNLIPEWEVQQAYPIEKYPLKDGVWFSVTEKLNGVRATFYRGELIGRSGVPFSGLDHITNKFTGMEDIVFDGELTLKDKHGLSDNEAFRKATGIINSDDADKTEILYTIFDVLPLAAFERGESEDVYDHRRLVLETLALSSFYRDENVRVLYPLYQGRDQSVIPALLEQMVSEDKEGLMINLNVPYKRRRHNGILKVKRFYTMDLPIIRCEEGSGRLAGTLGAIVVDFKGNEVNVGSGFTDEQRTWIWNNRASVIDVLAEVKYKEISSDKSTGDCSLQFPIFISLRTDKTDVSYG